MSAGLGTPLMRFVPWPPVYRYAGGQGTNLIKGVPSPADIGYDARRNRLLIPIFTGNRVEIWQLQ